MGARLYIPALGRFLQVDPVQGGTDNNYAYPTDPVNDFDLDGNWSWKGIANVASWASMVPGPIGMVASGVSVVAYAVAGDKKAAIAAAVGIAAAAIPGGAIAYKAIKTARSGKQFKSSMAMGRAAHRAFGKKLVKAGGQAEVR